MQYGARIMELNSGLETGMVTIGVVAMLSILVWLFFRVEQNGEKSLFLKMMEPYDEDIEQRESDSLSFPSFKENSSKGPRTAHAQGVEALNQSMRLIPLDQQKKVPRESPCAPSTEIQDEWNPGQNETLRQSLELAGQEGTGMPTEKRSLGNILVTDDDPNIREFIRIILEDSGYNVLEAEDGVQAITVLISGRDPSLVVDTIIIDLSMPNIEGVEALTYFQKNFPGIPLVILTGIVDLELAASYLQRGITNYLVKPVGVEPLKSSVALAIAERQLSGGIDPLGTAVCIQRR